MAILASCEKFITLLYISIIFLADFSDNIKTKFLKILFSCPDYKSLLLLNNDALLTGLFFEKAAKHFLEH